MCGTTDGKSVKERPTESGWMKRVAWIYTDRAGQTHTAWWGRVSYVGH